MRVFLIASLQALIDRVDAAADQAKREFSAAVDARSAELKQQLQRGLKHHARDIEVALQQQASLLAAAEAAAAALDAASAGSDAAHALFHICTRASSPSPAAAAAEFRLSTGLTTSTPLLGHLHAARRAVWTAGSAAVASAPESPVVLDPRSALSGHPPSASSSDRVLLSRSSAAGAFAVAGGGFAAQSHPSVSAASSVGSVGASSALDATFSCSVGMKGSGDGQFDAPWGVAVDEDGSILVTEKNGNRLQMLQRNEKTGEWIFIKKTGFQSPRGVSMVKGMLVVAHTERHELLLKPDSSFINTKKEWIHLGTGLLNSPNSVDIDSDLNVWVADTGNR